MIDIELIRKQPDWVKQQLENLQEPSAIPRIDRILELDKQRRAYLVESETLQASRNKLNKAMGKFMGNMSITLPTLTHAAVSAYKAMDAGDYAKAFEFLDNPPKVEEFQGYDSHTAKQTVIDRLSQMGEKVQKLTREAEAAERELNENMLWIPNMPHPSVKVGKDDSENIIYAPEGEMRKFDFAPKPHWELGPALDMIDFERGTKLSGARFFVLKGLGAKLQRALISLYLDLHVEKHGFTEVDTPYIVKEDNLYGAAQFPKFRDNVYADEESGLYLLPTAEVSVTNLHRDEILEADQLPLYYVAASPCWRKEKTSAGRDVRGIKRVHQFMKVEMYKFVAPETSYAELESILEAAADVARALKLPFRKIEQVTGDLGFAAAKKYDLEMYAPGCDEWLEVSSCSNCEAFQSRRAMIRYRPAPGAKPEYVHTLNGSGLALPRTIIAIMENYQQADGSIVVPEALRPYMGGLEVIRAKA